MTRDEQIVGMLGEILKQLKELREPKQASMKQVEFARRSGLSTRTVNRYVKNGRIGTRCGLIPYSELKPYLS